VEANIDAEVAVDQLLKRANLSLPAGDRAHLVETYPRALSLLRRLRMVEARYTRPLPVYPLLQEPVESPEDHSGRSGSREGATK
jgi:hypothetical protein